jgi:lysophospholipase L1-like esterase
LGRGKAAPLTLKSRYSHDDDKRIAKLRGKSISLLLSFLLAFSCSSPARRRSVIILCAGNSLTEQGYPPFLKRILRDNGFNARVLNFGRSGNTSAEYLQFLEKQKNTMAAERSDAILIELGTNDLRLDGDRRTTADFRRNMDRIIGIFREFRNRRGSPTRLLLATIPPLPENVAFPFGLESQERVENEINPAIRQLAADNGLTLVDNFAVFHASPHLLSGVHPTEQGYRLMAENWYKTLRELIK